MLGGALTLQSANGLCLPASIASLKIDGEGGHLSAGACINPWKSPRNVMEQVPNKSQSPPWIKDTTDMSPKMSKIISPKTSKIIDTVGSFAAISVTSVAPLKPESPTGQYLVSLLECDTHLFNEAVTHELQQIAVEEKADLERPPKAVGELSTLYRRMEELKVTERSVAVKELMYTMVVQKFVEAGIGLTPPLFIKPGTRIAESPFRQRQLEAVHSPEALKMIKDHFYSVIRKKEGFPLKHGKGNMLKISRLRVGELYANSIAYGYFIRRMNQRYQLERKMKASGLRLDQGNEAYAAGDNEGSGSNETVVGSGLNRFKALSTLPCSGEPDARLRTLRSYVAAFDHKILDLYATLRFKESLDVMEKQTEAVFGNVESHNDLDASGDDAHVYSSSLQLELLVLEALAFGSFLWDVEQHVEMHCNLHPNFD